MSSGGLVVLALDEVVGDVGRAPGVGLDAHLESVADDHAGERTHVLRPR